VRPPGGEINKSLISFPVAAEVEAFSGGHLVASSRCNRRYSTDESVCITTSPSKWPGVTSLRALLAREKDEDTPKLNILLCEAFVATYMSLFVYALSSCDSHILYRLVGHHFDNNTWSCLFGGGVKKLLRVASTSGQVLEIINLFTLPFNATPSIHHID
jgi:hypothetical protein